MRFEILLGVINRLYLCTGTVVGGHFSWGYSLMELVVFGGVLNMMDDFEWIPMGDNGEQWGQWEQWEQWEQWGTMLGDFPVL